MNNLQTTSVPGITLGSFSGSYIKDEKMMKKKMQSEATRSHLIHQLLPLWLGRIPLNSHILSEWFFYQPLKNKIH